ncbi:hypothetical protein J7T55_005514 [Diaporthe amygdali]|uniref:uncharacterized protein n=1 Tax=Phomopsis amygdali TaxID=1214568 RepID=UPI0022FE3ED8|nr:uncharacterized protein J7T55_005514 [Diaporthe amygdali]KAJ0108966.1 hypothetical protein J7T55_005514 [Diaporthe amygdali]
MADNNTPEKTNASSQNQSSNSFPIENGPGDNGQVDTNPSPLRNNSFTLAATDSRSSNLRFGAIGGPTTPVRAPQPISSTRPASLAFQHVTSIDNLGVDVANERNLASTRPGQSYVTSLTSWRRGSGEAAAASPSYKQDYQQVQREIHVGTPDESNVNALAPYLRREEEMLQNFQQLRLQQQPPQQPQQALHSQPPPGFGSIEGFDPGFDDPMRTGGRSRGFRPMNSKLFPDAANKPLTDEEKAYRDALGISHNYQGEVTNPANISAEIPDELNCAVWITGLPRDCSYKDLLGTIAMHRPGKVYASFISPPKPGPGHLLSHNTSAAKIIFYKPAEARNLLRVAGEGRLIVRNRRARAVPNRIKTGEHSHKRGTSRCIVIKGPATIVNEPSLYQSFDARFQFHTEEVLFLEPKMEPEGLMHQIEWRFSSHRAQAESAHKLITLECPGVEVIYAPDPCAPIDTSPVPAPVDQGLLGLDIGQGL